MKFFKALLTFILSLALLPIVAYASLVALPFVIAFTVYKSSSNKTEI